MSSTAWLGPRHRFRRTILKNTTIRQRMLATTMMGGVAMFAMAALPVIAFVGPTAAVAQDYTNGTLTGTVSGTNGEPIPGATVTVVSNAQGVTRTATTGANGQFRVPLIPTGLLSSHRECVGFRVADGQRQRRPRRQQLTSSPWAPLAPTPRAWTTSSSPAFVGRWTCRAHATGVSIDVDQLIENVPVARNITAVTLLAPGAVIGDFAVRHRPVAAAGSARSRRLRPG